MVGFEVATSIFGTKLIKTTAFNQVNTVHMIDFVSLGHLFVPKMIIIKAAKWPANHMYL